MCVYIYIYCTETKQKRKYRQNIGNRYTLHRVGTSFDGRK